MASVVWQGIIKVGSLFCHDGPLAKQKEGNIFQVIALETFLFTISTNGSDLHTTVLLKVSYMSSNTQKI